VAADYTRTIVFKVEDKAIKRATDRITSSLQNIEKILGNIEKKGLKSFVDSTEKVSDGLEKATRKARGLDSAIDKVEKKRKAAGRFIRQGLENDPFFAGERAIARTYQTLIKRIDADTKLIAEKVKAGFAPMQALLVWVSSLPGKFKLAKKAAQEFGEALQAYNQGITISRQSLSALENTLSTVKQVNRQLPIDNEKYRDSVRNVLFAEKEVNKELLDRKRILDSINRDQIAFRNKIKRSIAESRNRRAFSGSGFQEFSSRADRIKAIADEKQSVQYKALQEERRLKRINNRLRARGDLQRTKGLTIEERINKVLAKRGQIMTANGKIQKMQQNTIFKGGFKGAAGSAMIGGGFPLLFGQGGAGAAFGGIGGAIGGAFGGQFGFAGSIVATAIAQWIQGIDEFNSKLRGVNADMKALGFSSEFTGGEIKEMAKYLKISKDETMELFSNYMRFGKEIGTTLMKFYGNDFSSLFAIGKIKDQQSAIQAIVSMSKLLTFEEQAQLLAQVGKTTAVEMQIRLSDLMLEKQYEKRRELIKEVSLMDRLWYLSKLIYRYGPGPLQGIVKAGESPTAKRDRELRELNESMEENRLKTDQALTAIGSVEEAMNNLKLPTITGEVQNLGKEIKKLMNPVYQLTQAAGAIGNAFGESFKGIVNGSMTAQQALANLFQRTADHFLDMAAQMIAKQIQMKIIGIGLNFLGGFSAGGSSAGGFSAGGLGSKMGSGFYSGSGGGGGVSWTDIAGKKAAGGPVTGGKSYIVGEKGPELFVPGSSGNIVPNHAMGGANIVVNVDASGSEVEGNDAGAREFGNVLAVAIQSELVRQKRPGGLLA